MRRHAPPRGSKTHSRKEESKRVTLSDEGRERLLPRFPMFGTELARKDGLIIVQEDSGAVSEYHPDFIEHIQQDHCFVVPDGDGGRMRIHAGKLPTGKTLEALQDLCRVAHRQLSAEEQFALNYPPFDAKELA